jgi:hypothetical protein
MPRGKSSRYSQSGPSEADLVEFESALASLLQTAQLLPLPGDVWARLTHETIRRGYSLSVSPSLGGRAYRLRVPFGERALEIYISDTDNVEQLLTGMLAAVGKLPTRSST